MKIQDTLAGLKPVAGGAVGGIAVAAIVAFSFNWIYTAGATTQKVHQAKVETLAEVCETKAERFWTKQEGMKMAKLDGWDNEQRNQLATQFTPELPDDDGIHDDVVDACDEALQPA
jgi:glutamine amidotransferase PdxT